MIHVLLQILLFGNESVWKIMVNSCNRLHYNDSDWSSHCTTNYFLKQLWGNESGHHPILRRWEIHSALEMYESYQRISFEPARPSIHPSIHPSIQFHSFTRSFFFVSFCCCNFIYPLYIWFCWQALSCSNKKLHMAGSSRLSLTQS